MGIVSMAARALVLALTLHRKAQLYRQSFCMDSVIHGCHIYKEISFLGANLGCVSSISINGMGDRGHTYLSIIDLFMVTPFTCKIILNY